MLEVLVRPVLKGLQKYLWSVSVVPEERSDTTHLLKALESRSHEPVMIATNKAEEEEEGIHCVHTASKGL